MTPRRLGQESRRGFSLSFKFKHQVCDRPAWIDINIRSLTPSAAFHQASKPYRRHERLGARARPTVLRTLWPEAGGNRHRGGHRQVTLNAPSHPIHNLRLTADSPDLLAIIKAEGKV